MPANDRSLLKETLETTVFDVVIVGGGISGAWIAQLLGESGYCCALVERRDFASATSSASSKLLHGGVRYLQQMQFDKVRESTLERAKYLSYAPHIAEAVPFVVPSFRDIKRSKWLLSAGMLAYRMLGLGQNALLKSAGVLLPRTHLLSSSELNSICPLHELDHTGAVVFPEFHLYDSERCVWSIVDSARHLGLVAANYTTVESLLIENDRVTGVCARMEGATDTLDIKARLVVNAAGPWVDKVLASYGQPFLPTIINGYATGAHLITRQLVKDHAIAVTTQQKSDARIDRGGRHIFIIPWRGMSLIGTSYRETDFPDNAEILTQEDMNQLLDAVNDALPHAKLTLSDIVSAYSGLYPLRVETIKTNEYQGTGEYLLCDHAVNHNLEGIVTSLGAKLTTGRKLAELTVSLVATKVEPQQPDSRKSAGAKRLHCARYDNLTQFQAMQIATYSDRYSNTRIQHWIRCYGSDMDAFIRYMETSDNAQTMLRTLVEGQPDVFGQVAWAVEQELAIHLDDAILRRSSVGLLGISDAHLDDAAQLMGSLLGWNDATMATEIARVADRQKAITDTARHYYASR